MGNLTENFSKWEFKCSHCGVFHMNADFVEKYQAFRTHIDVALHNTCGYRCQIHNDSIKGASKKSQHLEGNAVDCWTPAMSAEELALMAKDFGFRGVICYSDKGIVHIDERPGDVWYVLPPRTTKRQEKEPVMADKSEKKSMWGSKTVWFSVFTGVLMVLRTVRPEWAAVLDILMAGTGTTAAVSMRQGVEKAK